MTQVYIAGKSTGDVYAYIGYVVEMDVTADQAGELSLPFNKTLVAPPSYGTNQIPVMNTVTKTWSLFNDFRDTVYWQQDGVKAEVEMVGKTVPEGTLVVPPPTKYHTTHDGTNWILDEAAQAAGLVAARNAKVSAFSDECGIRIQAGFESNALGADNSYRCLERDQQKMQWASESPTGGRIWVGELFVPHTQAQAAIVYAAARAHVLSVTDGYSAKYADVQNAVDEAAVDAIVWPLT